MTTPSSNVGAGASRGHTPLPWSRLDLGKWQGVDIGEKASGENPCIVHWSGFDACGLPQREYAANAAFIVRACNSHYELLEALEAATALATCCMAQGCYSHDELSEMARATKPMFDAAIAKARPAPPAGDLS